MFGGFEKQKLHHRYSQFVDKDISSITSRKGHSEYLQCNRHSQKRKQSKETKKLILNTKVKTSLQFKMKEGRNNVNRGGTIWQKNQNQIASFNEDLTSFDMVSPIRFKNNFNINQRGSNYTKRESIFSPEKTDREERTTKILKSIERGIVAGEGINLLDFGIQTTPYKKYIDKNNKRMSCTTYLNILRDKR
mmetsp:Transcript_9691/g.8537  ORF Transcript_9691/g.8537 Transcript_9691/m.8537 type:complete len:191 (+) Transcript_9691:216-788(+)